MTPWSIFTAEVPSDVLSDPHNIAFFSAAEYGLANNTDDTETAEDSESCPSRPRTPLSGPQLRFSTDNIPKCPSDGFVFGFDKAICDVFLPRTLCAGVSGRQFAVTFRTDNGNILIKNLSRKYTQIEVFNDEIVQLQSQRALCSDDICVHLGKMRITLSRPWDPESIGDEYRTFLATLASATSTRSIAALRTNLPQNPYYLGKKLGHGGYGEVYRAVNKFSGDVVAVKCFLQKKDSSWTEEHIIVFHEFNLRAKDGPQLVMELAPLGSMLTQSSVRVFNSHEGRLIIRQTLEALKYLHSRRITHRDIKPANILVFTREPMLIKVADFGISKEADEFNTRCGTERYTAPEVYAPPYTAKADVWSLGVVVLELWVGLPPGPETFEHENQWATKLIQHKDTATGDVRTFLDILLERVPEKRLTSAQCLVHPFLRLPGDAQPNVSDGSETVEILEAAAAHSGLPDTKYSPAEYRPSQASAANLAQQANDKEQRPSILALEQMDHKTVATEILDNPDLMMKDPDSPLPDTMPCSSKKYIQFLLWRGKHIAYSPSHATINITQLLQVASFRPTVLYRSAIQAMMSERHLEHGENDGGTYIAYQEAMKICDNLRINIKALPRFIRGTTSTSSGSKAKKIMQKGISVKKLF